MQHVLVLNPQFQPINEIPLKKAVKLLFRERRDDYGQIKRVAEPVYNPGKPIEDQSFVLSMPEAKFLVPKIIRIVNYVRSALRKSVQLTRRNIMVRDRFTCQYCGTKQGLTIDHVLPTSRGGLQKWENLVTACISCNQKKGNRLPSEAKMPLKKQPFQPTILEHIYSRLDQLGLMDLLKEVWA